MIFKWKVFKVIWCQIKTDVPRAADNTSPLIQSTACRGRERGRLEQRVSEPVSMATTEFCERTGTFHQQKHIWNTLETPHTELHFHPQQRPRVGKHWVLLIYMWERGNILWVFWSKHNFIPKYVFEMNHYEWCISMQNECVQNLFSKILGCLFFMSIATWFMCIIFI